MFTAWLQCHQLGTCTQPWLSSGGQLLSLACRHFIPCKQLAQWLYRVTRNLLLCIVSVSVCVVTLLVSVLWLELMQLLHIPGKCVPCLLVTMFILFPCAECWHRCMLQGGSKGSSAVKRLVTGGGDNLVRVWRWEAYLSVSCLEHCSANPQLLT